MEGRTKNPPVFIKSAKTVRLVKIADFGAGREIDLEDLRELGILGGSSPDHCLVKTSHTLCQSIDYRGIVQNGTVPVDTTLANGSYVLLVNTTGCSLWKKNGTAFIQVTSLVHCLPTSTDPCTEEPNANLGPGSFLFFDTKNCLIFVLTIVSTKLICRDFTTVVGFCLTDGDLLLDCCSKIIYSLKIVTPESPPPSPRKGSKGDIPKPGKPSKDDKSGGSASIYHWIKCCDLSPGTIDIVNANVVNSKSFCSPDPCVKICKDTTINGSLLSGAGQVACPPALGAGIRLQFISDGGAQDGSFRAGRVTGTQWNPANIGKYSAATGFDTTASGSNSTAMGHTTLASGPDSTATGSGTTASGTYSMATGTGTMASGQASFSGGTNTIAFGLNSTAMGKGTKASGQNSTAMGASATVGLGVAIGDQSTSMGLDTKASGLNSTAMGNGTTASGDSSTAMGSFTTASKPSSTAMGNGTTASGLNSTAMGASTTVGLGVATGDQSVSMGLNTKASGPNSTAMGNGTLASLPASTAMGSFTTASGDSSTAMGYITTAVGFASTAMGRQTTALGNFSTAMGFQTATSSNQSIATGQFTDTNGVEGVFIHGQYGFARSDASAPYSFQLAGGNPSIPPPSNPGAGSDGIGLILRTTMTGPDPKAEGIADLWTTGGYDFAEYFEWKDGNPKTEDRIGYFVRLSGDKIEMAPNSESSIGITSGTSGFVGNGAELHWHDANKKDKFGRIIPGDSYVLPVFSLLTKRNLLSPEIMKFNSDTTIFADVEKHLFSQIDALSVKLSSTVQASQKDTAPSPPSKESYQITKTVHEFFPQLVLPEMTAQSANSGAEMIKFITNTVKDTISEMKELKPQVKTQPSDSYDRKKSYVPRSQRREWSTVGLVGQIHVRDNGKCAPGSKCSCLNGIAVPGDRWYVMKRVDTDVVVVLFR